MKYKYEEQLQIKLPAYYNEQSLVFMCEMCETAYMSLWECKQGLGFNSFSAITV